MTMQMLQLCVAVGVAGAALAAPALAADPDILELELRLQGALCPPAPAIQPGPSLVVDVTRTGDRWERVWSVESDSRRAALHTGRVRRGTVTDAKVSLDIAIEGQSPSRVQVDMTRAADGTLKGKYAVAMPGHINEGQAQGRIKPARPPLPKGYVPVKPGEHPRILFRVSHLPALREKAKTPLGQALVARLGDEKSVDAIGAAVRWQLTRDPAMAELSRKLTERWMEGKGAPLSSRMSKGRVPEQIAVAYDLCYDAWPEDFKAKVVEHLFKTVKTYMGRMSGNEHVCSNWNARVHAGAGFSMLALWGEKGPVPKKPKEPAALPFWEDDVADWKRLGEVNMEYQRLFERTRYLLYLFCREATGTGGFRGENAHYGLLAAGMSIEYAACYRTMFGADVSPYNDITWMVPRMMFGQDYPEGGKPIPLDINGRNNIENEFFAYCYGIVPEKWKGAVLWAWNRHLGVSGPDDLARQMAGPGAKDPGSEAVWMFLKYPLSDKPQHPATCMPLVWEAPDHGYYGFRNGWTGRGDFVLQVCAKSHFTGGWASPNAGTFRLYGLGQSWNETSSARDANVWEENRVMVPDDPVNPMGQGRVTHADFSPDGSGSLTIDMNDVYGGAEGRLYTMYGNFRNASAFKDLGIRATRAMAVDYSGTCGAPCLLVLVDRVRGGKSKLWTWNLGDVAGATKGNKAAAATKVSISGNAFTIAKGNGTLQGTFVAPAAVRITQETKEVVMEKAAAPRRIPSIFARGGDDFFVVLTVQDANSPAPQVKVEGTGLDAKVTVGGQTIRFDGQKIVLAARGKKE